MNPSSPTNPPDPTGQPLAQEASYGTRLIRYAVAFRPRKTLAIHVHPDGSVRVDAPDGTPLDSIRRRVLKRGRWILAQQNAYSAYPPPLPERRFVSGETHRYLGRQYRLRVCEAPHGAVWLERGFIRVETPDPERAGRLVRAWLRARAGAVFAERFAVWAARLKLEAAFDLLEMDRRWGSCTTGGRILLNPLLIAAPVECIDYVIVHELCHLKEHNHGARFYSLLDVHLPEWRSLRHLLNATVELPELA